MKYLVLTLLFSISFTAPISAEMNPDQPVYVEFTLLNRTTKSIPLIIPRVMNPNLSPFSSSGVSLKVGQKILFKYKGKRQVLLVVTKELEGTELVVNQFLKQRKKEIDNQKK